MNIEARTIRVIGVLAAEWASKGEPALVIGKTSKGVFLRYPGDWIAFATVQRARSPFTINTFNEITSSISLNQPLQVAASGWEDRVWQPPLPPAVDQHNLLTRAQDLVRAAALSAVSEGYAPYLPLLAGLTGLPPEEPIFPDELALLFQIHPERARWGSIFSTLLKFLGQGRGLTPSGDDFCAGFFLASVRLFDALHNSDFNYGSTDFLKRARGKTTYLSVTMLSGAVRGWADERLIAMTDGLAASASALGEIAEGLRAYGASSGFDALAGCLAAIRLLGSKTNTGG